jgi:guanylate kinase
MMITVSGSSGVGKDTITDYLFYIIPNVDFLPSYTTRFPRKGDRGYAYVSDDEFSSIKQQGRFAWDVGPFGNRYGTLLSDLAKTAIDDGKIWFSILLPQTVGNELKFWSSSMRLGKILSIYLYCWDESVLRKRLIDRGDKDIERRITECRSWDNEARKYSELIWIDNSNDLEFTKKAIAKLVKNAGFLE